MRLVGGQAKLFQVGFSVQIHLGVLWQLLRSHKVPTACTRHNIGTELLNWRGTLQDRSPTLTSGIEMICHIQITGSYVQKIVYDPSICHHVRTIVIPMMRTMEVIVRTVEAIPIYTLLSSDTLVQLVFLLTFNSSASPR